VEKERNEQIIDIWSKMEDKEEKEDEEEEKEPKLDVDDGLCLFCS